jgi:hypothetical protein
MDAKTFSLVAGVIFAVVALFHLVRIFMEWTVIIGDWSIPMWASWIALVVAGGLALLGLRLRRWVVSHGPGLAATHGVRARLDRLTNAWPAA